MRICGGDEGCPEDGGKCPQASLESRGGDVVPVSECEAVENEMKAAQRTEGKCQPASLESKGGDEVPAKCGVKSVDVERVVCCQLCEMNAAECVCQAKPKSGKVRCKTSLRIHTASEGKFTLKRDVFFLHYYMDIFVRFLNQI